MFRITCLIKLKTKDLEEIQNNLELLTALQNQGIVIPPIGK